MDKVVYFLGAGFSAPLGFPVTSNFLVKSKDMFAENPTQYAHFSQVFKTIKELSIIKNYYNSDLFNIEEILSVPDMGEHLEGRKLGEAFTKYICDVINYYTPEIVPHENGKLPGNWYEWTFGTKDIWVPYGHFIASLLNLKLTKVWQTSGLSYKHISATVNSAPSASYSIITLNYDSVPEKVSTFIHSMYARNDDAPALSFIDASATDRVPPRLAKLHGSVDKGNIVPPTWNKNTNREIIPEWKLAYELLSQANQVRIIGYSLPIADTYVKYLFKSAVVPNEHLKQIDVICLDPDGSVKARYDDFISFQYYRFFNRSTTDYLGFAKLHSQGDTREKAFDRLEESHRAFVSSVATPR